MATGAYFFDISNSTRTDNTNFADFFFFFFFFYKKKKKNTEIDRLRSNYLTHNGIAHIYRLHVNITATANIRVANTFIRTKTAPDSIVVLYALKQTPYQQKCPFYKT